MSRWTYIIPRIIILLLIFIAVWVGADPLSRKVVVQRMQQATKSKVDVGTLRWNLSDQKLLLKDIAVGDRRDPMRNLFQADMIYLDLDWRALMNRQVVINHGQTSRLMFGTPRTNSGALPQHETPAPPSPYQPLAIAVGTLPPYGQQWLDKLTPLPDSNSIQSDQLDAAISQLNQKWTPLLDGLDQQLDELTQQTQKFGEQVKSDLGNPLRWKINPKIALQQTTENAAALENRIVALQQSLQQDLSSLSSASQLDRGQIEKSIAVNQFDAQDMSNLLLARQHAQFVDQAVNLIRWFQQTIPDPASDFDVVGERGIDIALGGKPLPPAFLIKEIELNGEAELFHQRFSFSGIAANLSSQPERHDQPTTVELRAQGDQHVVLTCTMDRRDIQNPVDRFHLVCPSLPIPDLELGDADSLALRLGDETRLQAEFDLAVSGKQVSGTIKLNFNNIRLQADHVAEMAGGETTQKLINDSLAAVDGFESTITINGTLEQYQHLTASDLGQKFSSVVNQMFASNRQHQIRRQLNLIQQANRAKINALAKSLATRIGNTQQRLISNRTQIANLQERVPTNSILKQR